MLPKPDEATVSQIEGFVYETEFYVAAEAALTTLKDEFEAYKQRPAMLEPLLKMFLSALATECTLLDGTVQQAHTTFQDINAKQLTPFLEPLTIPLTSMFQSGQTLLASNRPSEIAKQVDVGLVAACASSLEAQKKLIVDLVPPATSACQIAQGKLSFALCRLNPFLLARLAPLKDLVEPQRSACLTLLGTYKTPWILCLGSLTEQQLTMLTTRCARKDVRDALRGHDRAQRRDVDHPGARPVRPSAGVPRRQPVQELRVGQARRLTPLPPAPPSGRSRPLSTPVTMRVKSPSTDSVSCP